MKENWEQSYQWVIVTEGGFVNNPRDPGGATNHGVTQATYDHWRTKHMLPLNDVQRITDIELEAIYRTMFWDIVSGDLLPSGLDYATFDFAVNSGDYRAEEAVERVAGHLQTVIGVTVDGVIGPKTLAAIGDCNLADLINGLCDARQEFLEGLPAFATFGHGWTNRVALVRSRALGMANA